MADRHPNFIPATHNRDSSAQTLALSRMTGMARLEVSQQRILPGEQPVVYSEFSRAGDEGFIYILSGRGMLSWQSESHEIGPGDVIGLPTPSGTCQISNPFTDELVYLAGRAGNKNLYDSA